MTTRLPMDHQLHPTGPSAGTGAAGVRQPWSDSRAPSSAPKVTPILGGRERGVAVAGDLDTATVPVLDAAVAKVCTTDPAAQAPGTTPAFLLDLRDVTFLDAGGVFVLAKIQEQVDGCGDELHVAAPLPAGPRRVLLLAVTRGLLPAVFSPWSTG